MLKTATYFFAGMRIIIKKRRKKIATLLLLMVQAYVLRNLLLLQPDLRSNTHSNVMLTMFSFEGCNLQDICDVKLQLKMIGVGNGF